MLVWFFTCFLLIQNILSIQSRQLDSTQSYFPENVQDLHTLTKQAISSTCYEDLMKMNPITGVDPYKGYTLQMTDAIGKTPPGILKGNIFSFGFYQECEDVPQNFAHYALVIGSWNGTGIPFWHGLCTPASCNENDVASLYDTLYSRFYLSTAGDSIISQVQIATTKSLDGFAVFLITLGSLLGFLCVLGTSLDYFEQPPARPFAQSLETVDAENQNVQSHSSLIERKEKPLVTLFVNCWSLQRNLPKLLSLQQSPNKIACLDGIRVLSFCWVVLGHTYFFGESVIDNSLEVNDLTKRWSFLIVTNAFFSVDSFFLISGFLVTYLSLKYIDKLDSFGSYCYSVWHRYWRLTPAYFAATLIWWRLLPYWGKGPVWFAMQDQSSCDDYWWTNILYINNFIPTDGNQCMGYGWYLSNDFQFYVVSPIFVLLWARSKTKASVLWFFAFLGSVLTTAILVDEYHLNAYLFIPTENNFYTIEYIKPYTRASPYLIGMFLAFILKTWPNWTIPEKYIWWVRLGHLISAALLITSVFSIYPESSTDVVWDDSENAAYISLSRPAWSFGLAWIIFVCAKGHGGIVNLILSLPIWQPLAILSYGGYLLHPILLEVFYWNIQVSAWHVNELFYSVYYGAVLVFSLSSATILYLLIEAPFANLETFSQQLMVRVGKRYRPMM